MPENYWIATIKDDKLIFDSWDGMTKRLFDNREITKKSIMNFFNKNK